MDLNNKYTGVWSLFHFIAALSPSNTVDVGSEGRASGVGLTDGAQKQRVFKLFFTVWELRDAAEAENIHTDKILHIKKHN